MKRCPVCAATTFDDAEVCYGCLYRFEAQEKGDFSDSEVVSLPRQGKGFLASSSSKARIRVEAELLDGGKTIILHFDAPLQDSGR